MGGRGGGGDNTYRVGLFHLHDDLVNHMGRVRLVGVLGHGVLDNLVQHIRLEHVGRRQLNQMVHAHQGQRDHDESGEDSEYGTTLTTAHFLVRGAHCSKMRPRRLLAIATVVAVLVFLASLPYGFVNGIGYLLTRRAVASVAEDGARSPDGWHLRAWGLAGRDSVDNKDPSDDNLGPPLQQLKGEEKEEEEEGVMEPAVVGDATDGDNAGDVYTGEQEPAPALDDLQTWPKPRPDWDTSGRNLRVCTLVRNVVPFVHEWIAFHRLQGFDRFVIYDDRSTDGLQDSLAPYIETGLVELIELDEISRDSLPYKNKDYANSLAQGIESCQADSRQHGHSMFYCQLAVFNDCFARSMLAGDHWTAVFDVDEFLFRPMVADPDNASKKVSPGTLWEYLDSLPKDMSLLMIKGTVFGPAFEFSNWTGPVLSTHLVRPPIDPQSHEFIIPDDADTWKLCVPEYCSDGKVELPILGKAEKSFMRTDCLKIGGAGVHFSYTSCGVWWHGWGRPDAEVRLHHYQTLSKQEAMEKRVVNRNEKYKFYEDQRVLGWLNQVEDRSAADYFPYVEPCMKRTAANVFEPACALPPVRRQ